MAPVAPPAGWVSVQYQDPSGPLDPNLGNCVGLLGGSCGDSSQPSAACLNTLLNANYTDLNAFTAGVAGVSSTQPLFYLYYRAVTVNTPLCVAFYKTLKTNGGAATSLFSQPTRRWWCITLGVKKTPATGWSYPYVRDLCSYFYYQVMTPAIGDALVIAEDHNRTGDAGNIEADACSAKLAADALIVKKSLQNGEAAYYPWSNVRHLKPGKQMDFVQLTF
jgi:hypothetical protein